MKIALKVSPIGRDCLDVAREQMLAAGWVSPAQLDSMSGQAHSEVDSACATAMREPPPDPNLEDWRVLATSSLAEGNQ